MTPFYTTHINRDSCRLLVFVIYHLNSNETTYLIHYPSGEGQRLMYQKIICFIYFRTVVSSSCVPNLIQTTV